MSHLDQEVGVWDAVLLEPLTEDSFIANLQKRFKRDHIYTYIGNVLVSVNPYKKLGLYSADLVENYVKRPPFQLPPHMNYVLQVAALHLGLESINPINDENILGTSELDVFLKTENSITIYAKLDKVQRKIQFLNLIHDEPTQKIVIFTKTRSNLDEESSNTINNLQITTICGTPTTSLYETLSKVYSPLLNKHEKKIQKKIASLQSDLRSIIFSENSQNLDSNFFLLDIVLTLQDEVKYWDILLTEGKDRLVKKSAKIFSNILRPIAEEFLVIEALPLNDVEDLLERSHNVLDDLWRQEPSFPIERMKNLMDIIANEIGKFTTKLFKNCDLWHDDYNKISDNLNQGILVGEKWLNTCKQLTEIFWPNYSANMWKEDPYQPGDLKNFVGKLKKILEIRTVHKQLLGLSSPEEQIDLMGDKIFEPLKEVDILSFDNFEDDASLKKAELEFEYLLQPAEKRIAMKLKKQLSSMNANTRQLIYEFSRYAELISRPVLKKSLTAERQFLLTSLHEYIKEIQTQANTGLANLQNRHQISETIGEIVALRQLESKANEIDNVLKKLLDDLNGFESMKGIVQELVADLKHQHTELFDSWCSSVTADINTNKLTLKETDPVVQFSKEKLMKVNYPARLVTLISEVRQLRAMGYPIPSQIDQTTDHAKKFMKFARTLEQIANFHNTIGDRMVPSQKPMMLNSALELSKLVQEQEVVSWGEEKSVEKYVEILKKSLEKLSKENNLLTSYHIEVVDKIRELESADLLRDYTKWRETVKNIRNIVQEVESKGFKNMQNWRTDIDQKMSKVLETQYIKNLKNLHLNLQEIRVDLVFRNSKLEFSPDKSSLENSFEQQLKRYLEIPKNFRGISDNSSNIYLGILERNKSALESVDKNKLELFKQLASVAKHWQSWVQLEPLDTNKLENSNHWDLHFRASKTFGQEIAKLPSTEEKVGCFLVGLSRLRSDLESHNRSYWDQLVSSLKDSIASDVVKLQNYIDPSTATLTKQPVTMQEIGETGMNYNNIKNAHSEMEETFEEMLKKSQVLSSWSRETVDAVNRLKGAWERLNSLIDNYQHIMAKQLDTIKTTLNVEHENLVKNMERFEAKWAQMKVNFMSEEDTLTIESLNKRYKEMKNKKDEWKEVLNKKEKLLEEYEKFNLNVPNIELISEIETAMDKEEQTWTIFEEFYTEFNKIVTEYWIVIRKKLHILEDFIKTWEDKLKTSQSGFNIPILQELEIYKQVIPVLKHVRGEDFTEKHWLDVLTILKIEFKPVDQLILKDFLQVSENLQHYAKELQTISKKAASEIVIRQALKDIDQWDVQAKFILTQHKDSKERTLNLIKEFKDHLNAIGDHQILLQSLKNSADYDTFSEKADTWETKLTDLNYYLSSLAQVQKKWAYLEPIFGSGTFSEEKIRFDKIDKDFRKILGYIEKDLRVTALCRYPNLKPLLQNVLEQLTRCQHSLDNFLKTKRDIFPRFLFLGDDDLLEVVGQSSKEQVIQSHLKKIFAGIHKVKLDSMGDKILSICSLQGEEVRLANPVDIKQPVEVWLNILVKEMQSTLKELLRSCQKETNAPDPLMYPSQILCLSDNISFTLKCEQAINSMTLPSLLAKYKTQLNQYTSLNFNRNETDQVLELKLKSLLLETIHHIAIIEELLLENISKVSDWSWQKQLRFYSNSLGEVTVKMANARMDYSYEYLGNFQKLVRTPLTEKCFLTLTQAMHLGMGGNPYGPAGTGKTESVKDLGALLGRQVLVFNCDEGIDSNAMARILTGLVKTGAWGCFDEFNRLDEATLSAISMIIQPIQASLQLNKETVHLLDQEVVLNKHCGIFVTLNPAGSNYGGRNKLPDNLKQLFRPVVMSHPDNEQIARTILYSEGFQNADIIAKKLVEVFNMSSKLLCKQQHYDWGLRAIKSVLSGCGFAIKKLKLEKSEASREDELTIVVNVLHIDVISKLTFIDNQKFDEIIKNVFKDVAIERSSDDLLLQALQNACNELKLSINDRQLTKCLEFYEQLKQRMGVALVGPPKSGKSTIIQLVLKAMTKLGTHVKTYTLNPKSMSRQLLLGAMDNLNQWNEGVLTNYSLKVASDSPEVRSWIICDGDIDPDWVESLNSVLDDNRLLSLPSGWRIQFGPNINFIFESHSLKNASPATISRIGIIYLNSEDLQIKNYLETFLETLPNTDRDILESLANDYFLKAVEWITKDGELTIPSRTLISIAKTGLSHLSGVKTKAHLAVALVNGLGNQLQQDFREIFAQQVYDWLDETPPPLILQSFYDIDRDLIDSYQLETTEVDLNKTTLVLTAPIQYYLDLMRVWLKEGSEQNFLIFGPHGSAKTLMINCLVEEYSMDLITINCSASLACNVVIQKLIQHCLSVSTHKGKVLKPKKGKLILHLRNLHLLKHDKWGSSVVIEFLNQLIEYKGYFDNNTDFILVENVTIVGTFSCVNKLSSRFLSKLHVLNVNQPDREDLSSIIVAQLTPVLKIEDNQTWAKAKILKLSSTIIGIFEKNKTYFTQNNFNHHDVLNLCESLKYHKNYENIEYESYILEVTCYEILRLFSNRLMPLDIPKCCSIINDIFSTHWGISNLTQKCKNIYYIPNSENVLKNKYYFEKLNTEQWQEGVEDGLKMFERDNQDLGIIINTEILWMTSTVLQSASNTNGHVVLIGKSGAGRKTSVKISSAIQNVKLITPASGKSPYFYNDIKIAINTAGIECENVYLLLEDHLFLNESNLNAINLLISSGEVPDLYTDVELDSMTKVLKEKMEYDNFDGDLNQFFVQNVRNYLHIIVCFDEGNKNLSEILRNYPALLQNCNVVLCSDWSKDTTELIPLKLIEKINSGIDCNDKFTTICNSIKSNVATPSRFVMLVKTFCKIYNEKLSEINSEKTKLEAGVFKLSEAKTEVSQLKKIAEEQQNKLAEKQSKANSALDMISNTMKDANSQKEEMESLKIKTEDENVKLVQRKAEIEEELAEVEPLIQQARAAVGNIKSEALSEIRSLRAPPEVIRDILEGVLRLMGIQDTSWNSMKTFLAKRGVKEDIRTFDANRIQTENRVAVERLLAIKKDSFDPKSAKRASVAAAPLASWVEANVKYSKVLDKIRPLEIEQNKLKQNLINKKSQLGELTAGLQDVDTTVAKLKEQLSMYTKEAAEIEISLGEAQKTLNSAEALVAKLDDEFKRWQEQLVELSHKQRTLSNLSLLAAGFITYLCNETITVRQDIMSKWCKEFNEPNFNFEKFFTSERQQLQWQTEGLSSDQISIQNAVIIQESLLVPLFIDPTSKALHWLNTHFKVKKQNSECVSQNSQKFNTVLENAIRFGKILIIEDVESDLYLFMTLLRNEYTIHGERRLVKINNKLIDLHTNFKLILCSRNEQLQIPADLRPFLCVMNFNVTYSGFKDQLLHAAIKQEKPELEQRQKELLHEKEEFQERQHHLQKQLLDDLATSSGNILNNKSLLSSLTETKASSLAITKALEESKTVEQELKKESEVYKAISYFGSQLYFACNDFAKYNIMYLISITAYNKLFLRSLQTFHILQTNDENQQKKHLFQTVYEYMSRGIFKNDRLMFLLHLVHKLYSKDIPQEEMNLFLGLSILKTEDSDNWPPWIPKNLISNVQNLKSALPEVYKKLQLEEMTLWKTFMSSADCEKEFPTQVKLTAFQKVLIIQALRPDRLYTALEQCVLNITNLKSADPSVLELEQILKESNPEEPILFLTASGTDPTSEIKDLAKFHNTVLVELAMGEGQEIKAIQELNKCAQNGCWLILKNLHLVTFWLPMLLQALKGAQRSENFRIWLITESSEKFNYVLAQNSLKIAYEDPPGLKNNILRIYSSIGEKYAKNQFSHATTRLFFVFSCFHALIQERRTYIPQGWSKYYEFSNTDLDTCLNLTEDYWQIDTNHIRWKFIVGLCCEAIYGGRIENSEDLKILESYSKKYFKDDVLSHKWKPFGLNISLVSTSRIFEYLSAVKDLPSKDLPLMFGLPDNIMRAWEKRASTDLITKLKSFNQSGEGVGLNNKEFHYKNLAPFLSLWKKVNQGHEFIRMSIADVKNNVKNESAVDAFIEEEFLAALTLIQTVHKTFANLNKISKGNIEPEDTDRQTAASLLKFETPQTWLELWRGPKDPTKYMQVILNKTVAIFQLKSLDKNEIVSLSQFFNPETYLAATKQDFSKNSGLALDEISLETSFTPIGPNSIVLKDLLIEGAVFDNKNLTPCNIHSENINIAPPCYIIWKNKENIRDTKFLDIPLYENFSRENKILNIQVPCILEDRDKWIQAGVAFYVDI